jgi:mannose-6-phosphate isomerase
LHIEQSLACLEVNTAPTPHLVRDPGAATMLAECDEFRISRRRLAPGERLEFKSGEQPRVLSVIEGTLAESGRQLHGGENVLLPLAGAFTFVAARPAVVLVTENFARSGHD